MANVLISDVRLSPPQSQPDWDPLHLKYMIYAAFMTCCIINTSCLRGCKEEYISSTGSRVLSHFVSEVVQQSQQKQ